jgi:PPOX class probable F420-dependent enzyme
VAQLSDAQRAFLEDNPYPAVVTTLRADGSPHSTVVWIDTDGPGVVRFNTARGRAKDTHLTHDARVSALVIDPADQYRWVAVTGTAAMTEEGGDAHIDKLAKKYLDADSYPFRKPTETRVIVNIAVEKIDSSGFGA